LSHDLKVFEKEKEKKRALSKLIRVMLGVKTTLAILFSRVELG